MACAWRAWMLSQYACKEAAQLFWWNVNSCHRVIEQARGLGKWREHGHGDLNEPYHDWEQLKEGKVLKQQASRERCSDIWAPVQLWKGALKVERLPWEKTYTCFCSRAFLIWGITMATKVFLSNDQPQSSTLIAAQSNQWSTSICGCFDRSNVGLSLQHDRWYTYTIYRASVIWVKWGICTEPKGVRPAAPSQATVWLSGEG